MRRAITQFSFVAFLLASLGGCHLTDAPKGFKHPPKYYQNVVSLSPSTTELLLNVVQFPKLAGRTYADDFPPGVVKQIPIVATTKPDYEKLTTIHPDLIVYDADLYSPQDISKLRQLGTDMFAFDANTWPDFKLQLYKLGSLLRGESHVSDYLDRVNIEISNAGGKAPSPSPRVAIVLGAANGNDWIDGTESFLADIVRRSGGTPVGPSGHVFVKMSPEELVKDNPDVIITGGTKQDVSGAESLIKDPRLQAINAIKNTRANPAHTKVVPIDSDVLLRKGARVDSLVKAIYRAVTG
jgi:iron complex transport system substrate-binding protein